MTAHEIMAIYAKTKSIRSTAEKAGRSPQVIRRVLITNGIYPGERCREIARMITMDYTPAQIAKQLKISQKTVTSHLPYAKGSYVLGAKSENALRIAKCRKKLK